MFNFLKPTVRQAPDPDAPLTVSTGGVLPSAETQQRLDENKASLFTSDLSVSEFLLLEQQGYQPLGFVMGTSVYHVGFQSASWTESTELDVLTKAMYNARHLAMNRMTEEARYLGADGIVGVRLDIGGRHLGLGDDLMEFIAIGTAVRHPRDSNARKPPFTSNLSGQELYKLHLAGYRPTGLIMGSAVYHIAHQGFRAAWRTFGQNIEMTNYTQGLYHARELAMTRMQDEARVSGADGIIGVRVSEHPYNWTDHVYEFLATGTGVHRDETMTVQREALGVQLTASLDD